MGHKSPLAIFSCILLYIWPSRATLKCMGHKSPLTIVYLVLPFFWLPRATLQCLGHKSPAVIVIVFYCIFGKSPLAFFCRILYMSMAGKPGLAFPFYFFDHRFSSARQGVYFCPIEGIQHILCVFFALERIQIGWFQALFQISSCLVRMPPYVIFAYYFVHRSSQNQLANQYPSIHVYYGFIG